MDTMRVLKLQVFFNDGEVWSLSTPVTTASSQFLAPYSACAIGEDQMFAGNLTYNVQSSEPDKIMPHLFKGFDNSFAERVKAGDIIMAGANFGCGSSREHPSVGLAFAGIKAVICKSVNRIFYRSSVNQGLPILLVPGAVDAYKQGDEVKVDFEKGLVYVNSKPFSFSALPDKLMEIFKAKGLVNYVKNK